LQQAIHEAEGKIVLYTQQFNSIGVQIKAEKEKEDDARAQVHKYQQEIAERSDKFNQLKVVNVVECDGDRVTTKLSAAIRTRRNTTPSIGTRSCKKSSSR
jgi:uncharacterized protein with GYD domain